MVGGASQQTNMPSLASATKSPHVSDYVDLTLFLLMVSRSVQVRAWNSLGQSSEISAILSTLVTFAYMELVTSMAFSTYEDTISRPFFFAD